MTATDFSKADTSDRTLRL